MSLKPRASTRSALSSTLVARDSTPRWLPALFLSGPEALRDFGISSQDHQLSPLCLLRLIWAYDLDEIEIDAVGATTHRRRKAPF